MRLRRRTFGVLAAIAMALASLSFTTTASAHTVSDHSADCDGVSFSFVDFPDATNTVTLASEFGQVNKDFTGTSGSVSATWEELGISDLSVNNYQHQYGAFWTTDGGGSAGPFAFDATSCGETPPPEECPEGQVGTPPDCTTPPPEECPEGQVGTPPDCTTPPPEVCPEGTTGTPPDCVTPPPETTPPAVPPPVFTGPPAMPSAPPPAPAVPASPQFTG